MGSGIAQLAVEAGHEVVLHDVDEASIQHGRDRVREGLARRAARLELDADSIDDWVDGRLALLRDGHTLDAVGQEADVVIEAALEDLDLKRTIFRTLDAAAAADAILATNTSALRVRHIAAATTRPERVIGLHFFNPAPVMRLVEVVVTDATNPAFADRATSLVESWGRVAIRCADSPGFIVNRVNRAFTLEALAIAEAGEATVGEVDAAVRAAGYPMGPFELMDLVGVDVNLAAARGIYEGAVAAGDPLAERFRPSPIQERLVEAGYIGRKSALGFYRYDPEAKILRTNEEVDVVGGPGGLAAEAIVERITLAIVNEAHRSLDEGIATAADIDTALRLGAGHPIGPFERVEQLGGREAVARRLAGLAPLGERFTPAAALSASGYAPS
jgi:3-hydroxybutyryl-CoA dehydrogenase